MNPAAKSTSRVRDIDYFLVSALKPSLPPIAKMYGAGAHVARRRRMGARMGAKLTFPGRRSRADRRHLGPLRAVAERAFTVYGPCRDTVHNWYEAGSAYEIQPHLRSNARAVDRNLALKIRYSDSDGPRGHCARLSFARVGHISRQFHRTSSRSPKHAIDSRSP